MSEELSAIDESYFQWHITERCNKHCSHCYQNGTPINDLPLSDLKLILHLMDEALVKWERKGSISLTGGEPFVRKSELFSLMNRIDQIGSITYYDILTNGSLISGDVADALKKHDKLPDTLAALDLEELALAFQR